MRNAIKSFLIIIFLMVVQLFIYDIFLKPMITTWGASEKEITMPMAGDDENLRIVSTRAIIIHASKSEVWKWLIQLGADRNGFYSYTFLEEMMGYKTRPHDTNKTEFADIKVGDIVRGSIDEKSNMIPYNFKVLYVKPKETFVLDGWGTFLLKEEAPQQTRLIIRTQETEASNLTLKIAHYIIIPLHYIMERRTLLGIKCQVETNKKPSFSQTGDIIWFSSIVLSGLMIGVLVFIGKGFIQSILTPFILSSGWLFLLLIFNPFPTYGVAFLMLACLTIFIIIKKNGK